MDSDHDGIGNKCDNCYMIRNSDQRDSDWDGYGDICDVDRDGDGILNNDDKCPDNYDPSQEDMDGDRIGDACDNCKNVRNPRQVIASGTPAHSSVTEHAQ